MMIRFKLIIASVVLEQILCFQARPSMLTRRVPFSHGIARLPSRSLHHFQSSKPSRTSLKSALRGKDEEWEKWKTKFAGKFVIQSGTATTLSKKSAEETLQSNEIDSIQKHFKPSQILQVERGRRLTEVEVESLELKSEVGELIGFAGGGGDHGDEMGGKRLTSKVEMLLKDNLEDVETDMMGVATQQGTVSRRDFSTILQEGGESGTAIGQLLSSREVESLLDFAVNVAGDGSDKIYIQKLKKSLTPQSVSRGMKQADLFFDDGSVSLSISMPEDPSKLLDDALDELELLGLITRPQTWLLTNSRRQL
uniref:Uncharacterized protein n=1 Tax=Guillardia theta TaxID=55529 RepID=A0A7S4UQ81_GUITH